MNNQLIIVGASGHGKVIADIAKLNGYKDIVFLDDNEQVKICSGYPVCGTTKDILKYREYDFVVGIGSNEIRRKIQKLLISNELNVVSLVHPMAVVAEDVKIGEGSVVMAGAVINVGSVIGKGCIINTGATVDHDNSIGDFVHISVGSHLAGTVKLGNNIMLGAGSVVINNIDICEDCIIGAGAVVTKNVNDKGIYVGVPAQLIRTR